MDFEFLVDNTLRTLSLEKKEGGFLVREGDRAFEADIQFVSPHVLSIVIEGKSHKVYLARDKDKRFIHLDGQEIVVQEPSQESGGAGGEAEKSLEDMLLIKAPMPGKVIKIDVKEKDPVRKNQTLAIVEAMKMENEIKSSIQGSVKRIYVSVGDLVDVDKPLIELEQ